MNAPLAAVILAVALLLVILALSVKRVQRDQRIIIERMGVYRRVGGPGWNFVLPLIESGTVLDLSDHVPRWVTYTEDEIATRLTAHFYRTKARENAAATELVKSAAAAGKWAFIGGECRWAPDLATLQSWASSGRLPRNAQVWDAEVSRWTVATDLPELRSQLYPPLVIRSRYDLWIAMWPFVIVLLGLFGVQQLVFALIPLAFQAALVFNGMADPAAMLDGTASALVPFAVGLAITALAAWLFLRLRRRRNSARALQSEPFPKAPFGMRPPTPPAV